LLALLCASLLVVIFQFERLKVGLLRPNGHLTGDVRRELFGNVANALCAKFVGRTSVPARARTVGHRGRDAGMSAGVVQVWFHRLYQELYPWRAYDFSTAMAKFVARPQEICWARRDSVLIVNPLRHLSRVFNSAGAFKPFSKSTRHAWGVGRHLLGCYQAPECTLKGKAHSTRPSLPHCPRQRACGLSPS
jgi:hypothetical protein